MKDVESAPPLGANAGVRNRNNKLPSIKASMGWNFPEVKLASWDPENEKQWKVCYVCDVTCNVVVVAVF